MSPPNLLRLFLRGRREASVTINDEGEAWRVPFNDASSFAIIDEENLVPIDATRGVFARMGETDDGRRDIESLVFPKSNDWTMKKVQAWLTENGLDKRRAPARDAAKTLRTGFERGHVGGEKARVEESEDWWIIRDNVLTKAGVFNAMKRPAHVLEQAWKLYEGVPITHPHPPEIVEDFTHVGGLVRNVTYDQGTTEVRADYYLAKHTNVDGLKIRPENVKLNEQTIERVRKGDRIDNSQGFLFRFHEEHGVENGREFFGIMEELVPNHLAILLEQEGACSWEDGCGLARLALERAIVFRGGAKERRQDDRGTKAERSPGGARRTASEAAPDTRAASPRANEGVNPHMCDKDCTGTCATARELRSKLEAATSDANAAKAAQVALETIKNHKAVVAGDKASPASVAASVVTLLDNLERFTAAEAAEHARVARETAVVALKLDARAGKEDDLVKKYEAFPRPLLLEHKSALEALLNRGAAGTRRDNARPASGSEASNARESHLTVGFRGADGKWTGSGRPSRMQED